MKEIILLIALACSATSSYAQKIEGIKLKNFTLNSEQVYNINYILTESRNLISKDFIPIEEQFVDEEFFHSISLKPDQINVTFSILDKEQGLKDIPLYVDAIYYNNEGQLASLRLKSKPREKWRLDLNLNSKNMIERLTIGGVHSDFVIEFGSDWTTKLALKYINNKNPFFHGGDEIPITNETFIEPIKIN